MKGTLFLQLKPVATDTMFYSAMKHSTNLSGKAFLKVIEKVEFLVSPSSATILFKWSASPNLFKASPYAFLVANPYPFLYGSYASLKTSYLS